MENLSPLSDFEARVIRALGFGAWLPAGKGVLGWKAGGPWTASYHGPAPKLDHIGWVREHQSLDFGSPVATDDDDQVS